MDTSPGTGEEGSYGEKKAIVIVMIIDRCDVKSLRKPPPPVDKIVLLEDRLTGCWLTGGQVYNVQPTCIALPDV